MNKKSIIYLILVGITGLLFSCEKDEDKIYMDANPTPPSLVTVPDLTLERTNGNDTLEFKGTPVDPGFTASATYFLEACASGNNFADVIQILSSVQDESLKITVGDLNSLLLKKFPADQVSSIDFRIRAVLVVDAGTGAPGTSSDPFSYSSDVQTADVTIYGLPRLDLMNSGMDQKIESSLGDGAYSGYVKLDVTMPFTLEDPDTGTEYGANGSALAVDGSGITAPSDPGNGWYILSADVNALTYSMSPYRVGLIGDATPNGWSSPDSKMDYDPESGLWTITLDLTAGSVKFRLNDDWNNGLNLGLGDDSHPGYSLSNLWNDGSSQNIPIAEAGNYTITLSIGSSTYSCTITKNN